MGEFPGEGNIPDPPSVPAPTPPEEPTFQRQGDTWLQKQTVQLEDSGIELSDLAGTQTSPVELQLFENLTIKAPEAIEMLEIQTNFPRKSYPVLLYSPW